MKIFLALFSIITFTHAINAMDIDQEHSLYCSNLSKNIPNQSNKSYKFVFKNDTGVDLVVRGRFGPDDNILGYFSDQPNSQEPEIFFFAKGETRAFTLKEKYFPFRIRFWQFGFEPDSDMQNGKPIKSSERNVVNTVASLFLNSFLKEQFNYNNNIIIRIMWDNNLEKYAYKLEKIDTASASLIKESHDHLYRNW